MAVALYMDVHVHRAITDRLRRRGVDVITAQEDGTDQFDDDELLDRSTERGRVLFTFDDDLLHFERYCARCKLDCARVG